MVNELGQKCHEKNDSLWIQRGNNVSVGEQFHLRLDFDQQYYDSEIIDQIAGHFLTLLEARGPIARVDLIKKLNVTDAPIRTLVKKGLAVLQHVVAAPDDLLSGEREPRPRHEQLTEDQAGAVGRRCLRSRFDHEIVVVRGAGAAISGEETALLEALEGRPALPRSRPPSPTDRGAFGRPTCVHNVETLCHLPALVERWAKEENS